MTLTLKRDIKHHENRRKYTLQSARARKPEAKALYGERVVGLAKLSRLDAQQWWMEGLRVHPDFEGQRIASHLTDYLLAHWEQHCGGVIRLATASHRPQVHHLCERNGFQRVAELSPFSAPLLEPFSPNEQKLIFSPIKEIELLITEDHEDPHSLIPIIQLLISPPEKIGGLLNDYRRLAAFLGYSRASYTAPLNPGLQSILSESGFSRDWEHSIYIYEKRPQMGMV